MPNETSTMSVLARDPSIPATSDGPTPRTIAELLPKLPKSGQCLLIPKLDWKTYQIISDYFTDRPAYKIAYDRGNLEILAASYLHAKFSILLAQIVFILCGECG